MNRYNEAIQLIQQQQFIKAEAILKELLQEGRTADEVNWALGLTQIYLGQPQQAISYWNRLKNPQAFQSTDKKLQVEQSLDAYVELYASYNEALTYIQHKQYEAAGGILQQLMSFPDAKPIVLYEAYINVGCVLQRTREIDEMLQQAPKHILTAPSINKALIGRKYVAQHKKQQQQISTLEQAVQDTKRVRNWFGAGVGVLAAGLLATFILLQPVKEDIQSAVTSPIEEREKPVSIEQPSEQLQQQVVELEQQVQQLSSAVNTYEQKEQLLAQSNISLDEAVTKAQTTQYQRGYYYYRTGQYELAKQEFENSRIFESDVYFTDDALYYLIRSKIQLGESVEEHYKQFIDSQLTYMQQSPYYDDVLLQYAQYELEQKNTTQAKQLLQRLVDDFGQEWTGKRAITLLKQLVEA